ncbi:MAG: hypothetical protein WA152_02100 [Microgenomates group bacterium]
MRKIILSLFLFLSIILTSLKPVSAACIHSVPCNGISCGSMCCANQNECNNYLGTQPNPNITCNGGNGINTAIGCIPIGDTNSFVSWILGWSIGVGGGIAFLLIIYASFMIMTSQGDPPRLKAGQEVLTSAISGIIMLIFSVFILNFIGFDILGLDLL